VLVFRSGGLSRARQLAWYDRAGKRLGSIGKPGDFQAMRLAPDEKTAALSVGPLSSRMDTWVMNLATGVATRMTMDSQSSVFLGPWSPDSQRILINRQSGPPGELTVASGKMRILATDLRYCNAWTPDGGALICNDQETRRMTLLSLSGGAHTILDTPYIKRNFRVSPDGKWVAYNSEESGHFEVFVASFPSFAEKRQVSNGGGGAPFWRKDGKELLYVTPDAAVMSAEIQFGSQIDVGTPRLLFQTQRNFLLDFAVAVTSDAQRFLVLEGDQGTQQAQINVVVNWAADLKL
jgi:Tol biopolymer transport system component